MLGYVSVSVLGGVCVCVLGGLHVCVGGVCMCVCLEGGVVFKHRDLWTSE